MAADKKIQPFKTAEVIELGRVATDMAARTAKHAPLPGQSAPAPTAPPENDSTMSILRGHFAVSLCRAHRIGAEDGSTPCQQGLSCMKKTDCLDLADKTLAYTASLKDGHKSS